MSEDGPIVAMIAAVAENGVIGNQGRMPWRIPSELRHFRKVTMGKPLIMGRKTFAAFKKPLDGRDTIVLTHNRDYAPIGAIAVESVDQALKIGTDCAVARDAAEIMVIGGAEIYASMLPYVRRLYLTRVHAEPEGDVRFPPLDFAAWTLVESTYHPRAERDEHDYTVTLYERS